MGPLAPGLLRVISRLVAVLSPEQTDVHVCEALFPGQVTDRLQLSDKAVTIPCHSTPLQGRKDELTRRLNARKPEHLEAHDAPVHGTVACGMVCVPAETWRSAGANSALHKRGWDGE